MDHKRISLIFRSNCIRAICVAAMLVLLAYAASAQTERTIFHFNGTTTSGGPQGNLVADLAGNFYGTTWAGGSNNLGIVYEISPPVAPATTWTQTILYNFNGTDGDQSTAGLAIDAAGNLYGTTVYGGNGPCTVLAVVIGCGVAFELSPPAVPGGSWTESVLYNFQYGSDSGAPRAALIFDHAGNLYGTASGSGFDNTFNNAGSVFEISPPTLPGGSWSETTLFSFPLAIQGIWPFARLAFDASGNLYGTAYTGGNRSCIGALGCGVVFQLAPPSLPGGDWTETVLHTFAGGNSDGGDPAGGVAVNPSGMVVGTTSKSGSSADGGTVFALRPPSTAGGAWTYQTIHVFGSTGDGADPRADVIWGAGRTIYGTTTAGGSLNNGVVFAITPPASPGSPWTETILHDFLYSTTNHADGAVPDGGVIIRDGELFGTTNQGGPNKAGIIYAIAP
jgi:uncharacterized repeat protein (TIGR03803 family)